MFIGYLVVGLCALGHFGVQAKLLVVLEDIIVNAMDPKYFKPADTVATIDDDDVFSIAFTIIKAIPVRGQGHFTLFGLSMGEYVVPTGLDVEMSVCEMIVEPIIMGPIFEALGVSNGSCPMQPGTYKMQGYKLPVKNFPEEFEENKYQGTFEMRVDRKVALSVAVRTEVTIEYE